MIHERMIELSILETFVTQIYEQMEDGVSEFVFQEQKIDVNKLIQRYINLKREFLQPYVIDNTSKED